MMKNEISRRITSITLMGIMVAGGITFAVPGEVPQAAAQTQDYTLEVSATASPHGTNTFGGPQVIEIIVNDPATDNISTNANDREGVSEVAVDGSDLKMKQANSGKWYTYIVAKSAVELIDVADTEDNDLTDTARKYLTRTDSTTTTPAAVVASPLPASGFLGDAPTAVRGPGVGDAAEGNIANDNIHIVDVSGKFDIVYKSKTITVEYDEDITPGISVDRNDAPPGSQVHTTITDFRLNLDPTEADEWVFIPSGDNKYRMIDTPQTVTTDWDLGASDGNLEITYPTNKSPDFNTDSVLKAFYDVVLTAFNADDSNAATVNTAAAGHPNPDPANAIITAAKTAASTANSATGSTAESVRAAVFNTLTGHYTMMTFTETGSNTGVFKSWDSDDDSELVVSSKVGDTYDLDYDGESERVFVDDSDPVLALDKSAWNSGDELTVTVTSKNLNLNTKSDDDMTITSADLPILILGDPLTLESAASATAKGYNHTNPANKNFKSTLNVDISTHVGTLVTVNASGTVTENNGDYAIVTITPTAAQKAVLGDKSIIQYVGPATTASFDGATADGTVTLDEGTASKPIIRGVPTGLGTINSITMQYNHNATIATGDNPTNNFLDKDHTIVFDIFTVNKTTGMHNAIYRFLAEETSEGSGVFEAAITSTVLNQQDDEIRLATKDASYIGDDLDAYLPKAYVGSSSGPTVEYINEDARTNALTHDGTVSLDAEKYNVDSGVTITLTDPDLQRDTSRIDTYSTNAQMSTAATTLLNVKIGDCSAVDDTDDLFLRETAADSGAFEASFDVPPTCNSTQTTGNDLVVTYYDFRDGNSRPNESSDTATIGADTGSVELDATVYPVPGEAASEVVMVYVAVEDADYNTSSTSINRITDTTVTITIDGGDPIVTLGNSANPLVESATNSGVFEGKIGLTSASAVADATSMIFHKEIRQGDIITVSYKDLTDASGSPNTATDSATFDLRTATLQTDKSEYVIGQDALITLIEPDLNYDSDSIDTIPLTRILWDSDAYDGKEGISHGKFNAVPGNLRETGTNTGIFQVSITIPEPSTTGTLREERTLPSRTRIRDRPVPSTSTTARPMSRCS